MLVKWHRPWLWSLWICHIRIETNWNLTYIGSIFILTGFHCSDVRWASWHIKSLTTWLFVQTFVHVKINQRSVVLSLCNWNPLVTSGSFSQISSNADSPSMPYHHHVIIWFASLPLDAMFIEYLVCSSNETLIVSSLIPDMAGCQVLVVSRGDMVSIQ